MEKEEVIQRSVIQVVIKGVVKAVFTGCVEWKSETSRAGKSALCSSSLDPLCRGTTSTEIRCKHIEHLTENE